MTGRSITAAVHSVQSVSEPNTPRHATSAAGRILILMLRVVLRISFAALLVSSFALVLISAAPKRALAVNATLSFAPATSTVGVNANDAVDITVANVTSMGGY